jgi:hypothetical protein
MDFDKPPSRPVIKSVISAQAEWENWLRQNNFEFFRDGDGLEWRVSMTFEQLPSQSDKGPARLVTSLQIGVDVSMSNLVSTGTFDADDDSRLIEIASGRTIPLRMRRVQYEANSEGDMRDTLVRALPELRENFRKTSLHEVKRSLVGRWIESLLVFGHEQSLPVQQAGQRDLGGPARRQF